MFPRTDTSEKTWGILTRICHERGTGSTNSHCTVRTARQDQACGSRAVVAVRPESTPTRHPTPATPAPASSVLGPCLLGRIGSGIRDTVVQSAQYAAMTAAAGALLSGVSHTSRPSAQGPRSRIADAGFIDKNRAGPLTWFILIHLMSCYRCTMINHLTFAAWEQSPA